MPGLADVTPRSPPNGHRSHRICPTSPSQGPGPSMPTPLVHPLRSRRWPIAADRVSKPRPASRLDRPDAIGTVEAVGPPTRFCTWWGSAWTSSSDRTTSSLSTATAVWVGLMWVDPNHRDHLKPPLLKVTGKPRRALLITTSCLGRSPLSSHTAAGSRRVDSSFARQPPRHGDGRSLFQQEGVPFAQLSVTSRYAR